MGKLQNAGLHSKDAKQTQPTQKARSHLRAHICNVQKKHFLCFVTSLLAVWLMKQTSRIIGSSKSKGLTVVVETPKGRKPSEVEANEFE